MDHRFPGFPDGVNNVSRPDQMPATALVRALNVDLIEEGKPRRRPGVTKVYDGGGLHSLYSTGRLLLVVEAGELKCWKNPDGAPTTIATGLQGEVGYVESRGGTIWSCDNQSGFVEQSGIGSQFGIDAVADQPVLSASASGGFQAGTVMLAVTHQRNGLESGTCGAAYITLTEGQGVALSGISAPPDVELINIYATDPDGETLYRRASIPGSATSYVLPSLPAKRPLITQFTDRMPHSSMATMLEGYMYRAKDNVVYMSEPQKPWSYHTTHGFMQENSTINMLASGEAGLFVGCDEGVYYYAGTDPERFTRTWVSEPAIDGANIEVDGGFINDKFQGRRLVLWWTEEGAMIIGMPDGSAEIVRDMEFRIPSAERIAMAEVQRENVKQIVSVLKNPGAEAALSFNDELDIQVHRNGVPI